MTSCDDRNAPGLEVCDARRTVRYNGREARLPDLSFRLLRLLGERAPEPVPFAEIEQRVWNAQVSRETIKQRAKMLRDSLAGLGLRDGVESARSVGYRLTLPLETYDRSMSEAPWRRTRRVGIAAAGLAACAVALAVYLVQAGGGGADPLTLAVRSEPARAAPAASAAAWDSARRILARDLSRLSGLAVVTGDGEGRRTDLVIGMERIVTDGREAMALELVETDTGVVLWAETYPLNEGSWDRAVSHFVADIHAQVEALGLRLGQDGFPQQPRKVQGLYLSAASLARSGDEADLLAARSRLERALATRPRFALARALRTRIDSRLVLEHGHDPALARAALAEARSLVADHPELPEFRRALATAQMANGDLRGALQNLRRAQRDMPFLRRDILALERRIEREDVQASARSAPPPRL